MDAYILYPILCKFFLTPKLFYVNFHFIHTLYYADNLPVLQSMLIIATVTSWSYHMHTFQH